MGRFREWLFGPGDAGVTLEAPGPAGQFSVEVDPALLEAMTGGGRIAPRISRAEALQVPAVLRARNLIAGTLGSLPIKTTDASKREVLDTYLCAGNVDPDVPNSVTMAYTVEDLLFEGVAWWRVTKFGWHGYPVNARWVPVSAVTVAPTSSRLPSQERISADTDYTTDGRVYIDGVPVPDNVLIRFDSPNPPLLRHAARAIRTALTLDRNAATYSDDPLPLAVFTPKEGVDPGEPAEIEAMLDGWDAARRRRATGYIGAALDFNPVGWSPEQMQLADARQHAVLEIARAAGVDPEDLGVSTTSRTYQNSEQRRQDLIDFTLGAYVAALNDRLSMRDVLPRGYQSRIRFDSFLRSDTMGRMNAYKVGLEVGAYTKDEIRDLEGKPRLTPAQQAAQAPPPQPAPQEEPEMDTDRPAAQFGRVRELSALALTNDADHPMISFDDPEANASFRVNEAKRTISGMVVPWNKTAMSGGVRWKFAENSLRWGDASRVKLNLGHDRSKTVGYAAGIRNTSVGLDVTFKIARGAEGDQALTLAADKAWDGLSVEIDFEDEAGDEWQRDPADEMTRLVRQAKLAHVGLTPAPAFDDARVAAVAASQHNERTTDGWKGQRPGPVEPAGRPVPRVRVRVRQVH